MSRIAPKSAAPSHRLQRVAEQIRHAVSELLARGEVDDPVLNRRLITKNVWNYQMLPSPPHGSPARTAGTQIEPRLLAKEVTWPSQ